jgi:hypothetical protein
VYGLPILADDLAIWQNLSASKVKIYQLVSIIVNDFLMEAQICLNLQRIYVKLLPKNEH